MLHAVTTALMRPQQKGYHPNAGSEPSDMKCDCWKKLTPKKGSGLAAAGYRQPRPALIVLIVTHGWTLEACDLEDSLCGQETCLLTFKETCLLTLTETCLLALTETCLLTLSETCLSTMI